MDKASLDIQSLYSRPLIGRPDAESAEVMEAIADRLSMYPVTDDRTMIAAALYGYAKDLKGSIEHLEARVKELEGLLNEAHRLVAEREYLETMEFYYSQDMHEPSPAEWGLHCGYQQTATMGPCEQFDKDVEDYHSLRRIEDEEEETPSSLANRIKAALPSPPEAD